MVVNLLNGEDPNLSGCICSGGARVLAGVQTCVLACVVPVRACFRACVGAWVRGWVCVCVGV